MGRKSKAWHAAQAANHLREGGSHEAARPDDDANSVDLDQVDGADAVKPDGYDQTDPDPIPSLSQDSTWPKPTQTHRKFDKFNKGTV